MSLYNAMLTNMGVVNTGQTSLKKDCVDALEPRYLPSGSERIAHSDDLLGKSQYGFLLPVVGSSSLSVISFTSCLHYGAELWVCTLELE